jgi:hypothetical protein
MDSPSNIWPLIFKISSSGNAVLNQKFWKELNDAYLPSNASHLHDEASRNYELIIMQLSWQLSRIISLTMNNTNMTTVRISGV